MPSSQRDAILLIAVHSRAAYHECAALLSGSGFAMLPSRALRASLAGTWRSAPDMLCIGPAHPVGPLTHRLIQALGFD